LLTLDLSLNRVLEIPGLSSGREVDTLEEHDAGIELVGEHDSNGGLSGTGTTNNKSVLEVLFSTTFVSNDWEVSVHLHDVFSTG
jgi:hypothetical protein